MRLVSKPVLCNYYVTYRCNAKCGFCDIWEIPSSLIKKEDVETNLHDLKKLGVKVIDFTGGEPLLHKELPSFLKLAKDLGFITTLTTNGLLYPKRAKELKGLVDMLHFSLDSASSDVHDEKRGVKCFDKVMESIEIAKRLGERPDILFTVFDDNLHELERVYEEITIPNGLVLIINPVFEYNGVGEKLSSNSLDVLEGWVGKPNVFLNKAFLDLRREGGNHISDPVCKAATSTIVISPENELVLPCYHLGLDKLPIEGNLRSLWESSEVEEMKKLEGRLKECEGCTINCYMQPSFSVEMNRFFWKSLGSTWKYNMIKGTWKELV